jgi:hypothetical protein
MLPYVGAIVEPPGGRNGEKFVKNQLSAFISVDLCPVYTGLRPNFLKLVLLLAHPSDLTIRAIAPILERELLLGGQGQCPHQGIFF